MPHRKLYCPRPGYSHFEVRLYNREVRALVKANEQHRLYADLWADDQVTVVEARDAGEARAIACRHYPPDSGFVISAVSVIQ